MISRLFGLWKTDGFILPSEINGWLHCKTPGTLEVAKDLAFVAWSKLCLACRESNIPGVFMVFSCGFSGVDTVHSPVEVGSEYPIFLDRVSKTSHRWFFGISEPSRVWWNVKIWFSPTWHFSDTCNKLQLAPISELDIYFLKPDLPSPWLIPW